jgi:hypothetical protein
MIEKPDERDVEDMLSEAQQLIGRVRAKVGRLGAEAQGPTEADLLFDSVYGRVELEADSMETLVANVERLLQIRDAAAMTVVFGLAARAAEAEHVPIAPILDETENAMLNAAGGAFGDQV